MKKYKVTFQPEGRAIRVLADTTVKEAALACGIMIATPCGGLGRCGKCLIQVTRGECRSGPRDKKFIDKARLKLGFRLACQARVKNDIVIRIPDPSRLHPQEVLAEAKEARYELDPEIRKVYESEKNVTSIFCKDELLGTEAGDTRDHLFGMVFDIGTTTVVGSVIDLNEGKRLSISSRINGQVVYGDDAISRISFAQLNEDGLRLLNEKIISTINQIIDETTKSKRIKRKDIYQIVACGNSVMHHLALSIHPSYLANPPYGPAITEPFVIQAEDLGIRVAPFGQFKFLPLIGGFVGADSVGLILASQIHNGKDVKLAVDIGTNGEVIIGTNERLLATSCAAGPAFEGAHITCGMRATSGAIESVQLHGGRVSLGVIGGGRPLGICGSGLIDTIGELLKAAIIDRDGRMGRERFTLYRGRTRSIGITQADVREVQLAKGAIRAGIEVLKKGLGIEDGDISEVILAGAFGNYIRPESAIRIGLIPNISLEKIRFIGNGPLRGAEMALCSSKVMDEALEISRCVEHINLSTRKDFQEEFVKGMSFPKY